MSKEFTTFKAFYPFYLSQHNNKYCRLMHFIGTSLVISLFVGSFIVQDFKLLLYIPFAGYSFAWIGHFIFEKNRPATFTYPLFSLMGDFKMYFELLFLKIPFNPNQKD